MCGDLTGQRLLDVLSIERPQDLALSRDLAALVGRRLHIALPAVDGKPQLLLAVIEPCAIEGYVRFTNERLWQTFVETCRVLES